MTYKAWCMQCRWDVKAADSSLVDTSIHEHYDRTGHQVRVNRAYEDALDDYLDDLDEQVSLQHDLNGMTDGW